jgi:gamma-glutamyltranspeptidase / glutathione hydrolase
MFTTRPEIRGTFGVVASTHWIASAVGMSMLEKGGNAFDACVATGLMLQILEPQLCGPGGDLPAIFHSTRTGKTQVLCAQGVAPKGATIAHYRGKLGLDLVPGSGFLATVVPGVFAGYMALLADHGSLDIEDVLSPAIHYARHGHPVLARVCQTISDIGPFFAQYWPSSAATWMPGGKAPTPESLFKNPVLADTYERILKEAKSAKGGREPRIRAARRAFMEGFVAEAIERFATGSELMDSSGRPNKGVITAQDLASFEPSYEEPLTYDYENWTLCKTGPWGQGPVLAQTLSILKGFDIARMDLAGAEFVHTVAEAMKLAFADREAYYGDPKFSIVPMDELLGEAYASGRRRQVTGEASRELRPGIINGFEEQVRKTFAALAKGGGKAASVLTREPTMAHLLPGSQRGNAPVTPLAARSARRGDTVHIDVIDRHGNMISATPSGGWLQSSPTVPELGFCLNTRGQMFWLDEGLPSSLEPGKRPRTTLSPSLALEDGEPRLVFGTPGGDQQDQWQATLFLRHVHHGLNLQEAIDLPMFHTAHFPGSFYPRDSRPGHLLVEETIGKDAIQELEKRGHDVEVAPAWSAGRLTAAKRGKDGVLRAAATPRLMQAYAIGR